MSGEVSRDIRLYNEPANRNKEVILAQLQRLLPEETSVLEIGSGSGQHALSFANAMPGWRWQCTDCNPYFDALCANLADYPAANLPGPIYLDIADFPEGLKADVVFCANVVHIMSERLLPQLFDGVVGTLAGEGRFILYGPYKYDGNFTTPSNAEFDLWLKQRNPESGIRDIERLTALGEERGMRLMEDVSMPANNQLLIFGFHQN